MAFGYQPKNQSSARKNSQAIDAPAARSVQLKGDGFAEQTTALSPRNAGYESSAAALRPSSSEPVQFQDYNSSGYYSEESEECVGPSYYDEQVSSSETEPTTAQPGVEVCARVADLPGNSVLGVEHWWIRTPNMERGMGPATGGVPGRDSVPDVPGSRTAVNDHTGQGNDAGSTCVPAGEFNPRWRNVDQSCVESASPLGRSTGRWVPPVNDCHTWVEETMEGCRPQEEIEADADRAQRRLELSDRMY